MYNRENVKSKIDSKEKHNSVSLFGNNILPLYHKSNNMGINKLKVVLTEEAQAFLNAQPFKAQQKIYYNIFKVEEGVMKVDIFKKLENTEIWEFRTLYNGICYRLFSFWDTEEETLVIATHGIVKKTQKTPLKEIAKAEEIRKEYFNNKTK